MKKIIKINENVTLTIEIDEDENKHDECFDDYDDYDNCEECFNDYEEEPLSEEEIFENEIREHAYNSIELAAKSPETDLLYGLETHTYLVGGPFSGKFSNRWQRDIYNQLIDELIENGYRVKTTFVNGEQAVKVSW